MNYIAILYLNIVFSIYTLNYHIHNDIIERGERVSCLHVHAP